jgi:hypothetical protein
MSDPLGPVSIDPQIRRNVRLRVVEKRNGRLSGKAIALSGSTG